MDSVHVNSDEKSVVCLLSDCRLLLIQDVTELVKDQENLNNHAMEVVFDLSNYEADPFFLPNAVYLAFEYGRVGVVTVRALGFSDLSILTTPH